MIDNHAARALAALWFNAAFLPVAVAIDLTRTMMPFAPADDADSGAPEGADVVSLDKYREANDGR